MRKILVLIISTFWFNISYTQMFAPTINLNELDDLSNTANITNIVISDVSGDGCEDIILALRDAVFWYPKKCSGKLEPKQIIDDNFDGNSIVAFDADNDGDQDIIATSYFGSIANLYLNESNGSFILSETLPFSFSNAKQLSSADIDNDGDIDILIAYADAISWLENEGDATFLEEHIIQNDLVSGLSAEFYDLDGDGDLDVLGSYRQSPISYVSWYENLGNGVYSDENLLFTAENIIAFQLIGSDLDGDGDLDILSNNKSDSIYISWRENFGDGVFSDEKIIAEPGTNSILETVDFDNDGISEIIVQNQLGANIYYKNSDENYEAQFNLTNYYEGGINFQDKVINTLDYDYDGDLDILTSTGGNDLVLFLNKGNGLFSNMKQLKFDSRKSIHQLMGVDVNQDGLNDVVGMGNYGVRWYKSLGNGDFDCPKVITRERTSSKFAVFADFDGDNLVDIVSSGGEVSGSSDEFIYYFKNLGNEDFGLPIEITGFSNLENGKAADIDNDGDIDLVIVGTGWPQYNNGVILLENNGSGFFNIASEIDAPSTLHEIELSDLNNDGQLDLIFGYNGLNYNTFYRNLNLGNLEFSPRLEIDRISSNGRATFSIEDVNEDNRLDFLIPVYNGFEWYSGNGDGSFSSIPNSVISSFYNGSNSNLHSIINVADFNNDGANDVIVGNAGFVWFENTGAASYETRFIEDGLQLNKVSCIFPVDTDKDGDLDLLVNFNDLTDILIYENLLSNPKMRANVFYDINNNGVRDNGERGMNEIKFNVSPFDILIYSAENGNITFSVPINSDSITIKPKEFWTLTTEFYSIDVSDTSNLPSDTIFFGLYPIQQTNDLTLNIISSLPRCNTEVPFQIVLTNTGTTILEGTLETTNIDLIDYIEGSAEPSPDNVNNGQLSWDFEDLYPGESFIVDLNFIIDGPPDIEVGDSLCLNAMATILTESTEETTYNPPAPTGETDLVNICHCTGSGVNPYVVLELPQSAVDGQGNYDHANHGCDIIPITDLNNDGVIDEQDCLTEQTTYTETTFLGSYKTEIRCSFDPNDKAANPAGIEDEHWTLMGQDIIYTIRFQNTGNDTAFRIELIDTLSEYLNIETFDFITTSHQPVDISIESIPNQEKHVLKFLFENILLPDSTTDEVGSNGFVQFSIRPEVGLPDSTLLTNNAGIYFDLNPPVITNTVENTLVYTLPTRVVSHIINELKNLEVEIYPNPFSESTIISIKDQSEAPYDIKIFNIKGGLIQSIISQSGQSIRIDKKGIANGMYILNVYKAETQNLLGSYKLIVE